MSRIIAGLLLLSLIVTGCETTSSQPDIDYPAKVKQLETELAQAKADIEVRDEQIANLQSLSSGVAKIITKVDKVKLGRFTRLVDEDKDKLIDKLVIYLQLYDSSADLIKVSGSLRVELWDLNLDSKNMIASWDLGPEMLESTWDGGLLADHYHIVFPIENYKLSGENLNLKCTFVESLNGKSWEVQKVLSENDY